MSTILAGLQEKLSLREDEYIGKRLRRQNPIFIRDSLHMLSNIGSNYMRLQVILSLFRDDYPWLYYAGLELVHVLWGMGAGKRKSDVVETFKKLIEFTFGHPTMQEMHVRDKESYKVDRELHHTLIRILEEIA